MNDPITGYLTGARLSFSHLPPGEYKPYMCGGGIIRGDNVNVQQSNAFLLLQFFELSIISYLHTVYLFFAVVEPFTLTVAAANLPFHCLT